MTTNPKTEQAFQAAMQTPEGQAAFKNGPPFESLERVLTVALKKGLLQPTDLDPQHYAVDQTGNVHMNEGVAPLAKLAIGGIGALAGGSILGALGAGGGIGGQTPAAWAAGSTTIGGAGGGGLLGAGSTMTKLLGSGGSTNLMDAGKALTNFGQGQTNHRVTTGNQMQDYDKLALEAQKGRNENESDALQKLNETSYIQGGGSTYKPPTPTINGKTYNLPDLGLGPAPITPAMKTAASDLQAQLMNRFKPGGSVTPTDPKTYTQPSGAEKVGEYGGLGVAGLNLIGNFLGK